MIADKLEKIPNEPLVDIEKIYELKDEEEEIAVEKIILKKGIKLFKVSGKLATRIMGRVNIADNESMYFLHKTLEETGITSKLEKLRNRRRRFNRNCRLWIWVVYIIKKVGINMAKITYEEKIYSDDLTEKDKKILRIYRGTMV